jgi:predicted O-methyltransferase YrrM
MFNSKKYWNDRYLKGGDSGAGSYNNLSKFKGDVINNFIEKNQIKSIIDYGVGDGNQLKLFNTENLIYTGIDVSEFIISKCKEEFKDDITKRFIHVDNIHNELKGELVLSCDVIYHLIEEHVYKEYMEKLFSMSKKYVIIYAKNEDINHAMHVKFRKFSNYIESNLPEWQLIKHIPNKFPQLKLGDDNNKTSPSDFYIYEKHDVFLSLTNNWKSYIETHLMKIIKKLNVKLEGNIYSCHHSFDDTSSHLSNKRQNIYNVLKENEPKTILEIGFNAGFSCLLMKMVLPDVNITCIDLNEHKYVMPCFDKLSSEFNGLNLIPGSSYDVGLPQLINENKKFDFIHIDGDHRLEGATKDIELCLKLCHDKTIILFDDTNLHYLDNLCTSYVNKGKLKDYHFDMYLNNQKYKHRFFQINSKIPVYISLTSIFKNQDILLQTLQSIMKQTILPDKIFLYLSDEPYILDTGFKDKKITNSNLLKFINNNSIIDIKWVKNTGSYRKLLPLLKDKWNEDCIIITIDDDTVYDTLLIENLINDYNEQNCVIGYRGFTALFDKFENFDYDKRYKLQHLSLYNFFTGKGGILYKPQFFHKTHDLIFNDKIYIDTCPIQDDIWFYIIRLFNNVKGYLGNKNWQVKDLSSNGLYINFNRKNKNNNKAFIKTFEKLKQLDYNIYNKKNINNDN